jgi:hypothetical protein
MIRSTVARAAGGVIGAVAGGGNTEGASPLSKGTIGYLGVYDAEIVLFAAKRGALKPKPTDTVLASARREVVRSISLDKGKVAGVLAVAFADGTSWQFDIPRVHLGGAQRVASAVAPAP